MSIVCGSIEITEERNTVLLQPIGQEDGRPTSVLTYRELGILVSHLQGILKKHERQPPAIEHIDQERCLLIEHAQEFEDLLG